MKSIILEIRDRLTSLSVLAVEMKSDIVIERHHLRRYGFPDGDNPLILVSNMDTGETHFDHFEWRQTSPRTLFYAHKYIADHFGELKTGDVIDVEFLNGETKISKESEYKNTPVK